MSQCSHHKMSSYISLTVTNTLFNCGLYDGTDQNTSDEKMSWPEITDKPMPPRG